MSSDHGSTPERAETDDGTALPPEENWDSTVELDGPEYDPAPFAGVAAVGSSVLVVIVLFTVSPAAVAVAGLGAWALTLVIYRGYTGLVTVTTGLLFGGVVLAGITSDEILPLVVAGIATAVAYDSARYGVRLGHQFGSEPTTIRGEVVHVTTTLGATGSAGLLGYLVYGVGGSDQPASAVIGLMLAVLLFVSALYLRE